MNQKVQRSSPKVQTCRFDRATGCSIYTASTVTAHFTWEQGSSSLATSPFVDAGLKTVGLSSLLIDSVSSWEQTCKIIYQAHL